MHFIIHLLIELYKYVTYCKFERQIMLAILKITFCVSFMVLLHPIDLEFVPKDSTKISIFPI